MQSIVPILAFKKMNKNIKILGAIDIAGTPPI
jgi:hypothetical protein